MSEDNHEAAGGGGGGDLSGGSGGTSKIVVIASLVNLVATIGVIAVLFLSYQKEKSQPSVEDIVAGQAKSDKGHGGGGSHAASGGGGEHGGGGGHGGGHGGAGAASEPVTDAGKIVPLDPFTVNLSTGSGSAPRYVRMNVSMELEQGAPEKEFEVKLPRVRDTIISLLNSKKPQDMTAPEGREQLKEDIKRTVNSYMLESKVKGVYFTNFAVSN
jgi:flagellar FliL protein